MARTGHRSRSRLRPPTVRSCFDWGHIAAPQRTAAPRHIRTHALQEGYRRATPILMQSGMKKGLFGRGTMLDQRSAACGVARITMGTTILARKYAVGVMAALFFLSLAWSARAEPVTLACRDLISAPYRMQLDLAAAVVRDLDVDSSGAYHNVLFSKLPTGSSPMKIMAISFAWNKGLARNCTCPKMIDQGTGGEPSVTAAV